MVKKRLDLRIEGDLRDGIDLESKRTGKSLTAIVEGYIAIPPRATEMCAPLLASFATHMWNEWELLAEAEPGGQLPLPIQCYLDEFANLGKIYNLGGHLTTMRFTGVGLLIILQASARSTTSTASPYAMCS